MEFTTMLEGCRRAGAAFVAALILAGPAQAVAPTAPNSNWPCVQQKVLKLTSTQIWDGPPVEDVKGWFDHEAISKLLPVVTSRRVPMDDVGKAIKAFAEKLPAAERDKMLTLLFAGALSNLNDDRRTVMTGIERFQQRQKQRAETLEQEGIELGKLKESAGKDTKLAETLAKAQERYDWDARIFQERNQNMPLACEIPVLIEQRAFEVGREIRANMSK